MEVKVSVVIPTYRRPELLKRCLKALFQQAIEKAQFEIIVVSDGPDAQTLKTVKKLRRPAGLNVKFLSSSERKGPAAARNLGWLEAKGKLIAFTDDDCIPAKTWINDILEIYKGDEEIAFTGKVNVPISEKPTDYELNIFNLEVAEFVTANCICTKKALLKVGGFDERFRMAWREDSDLHFKFIEHNIPIQKISARVVHPVRKVTWGISIKEQKKSIFNALLYKKYPQLYRQRIKPYPSWNYYLIVICFLLLVTGTFLNWHWFSLIVTITWLMLTAKFIIKRLSSTSHSFTHVLEIIITSIIIPFISIYWQIYGSLKYRVLFL
jgi:glycosyltransferase involved in cell wall biosynthesis